MKHFVLVALAIFIFLAGQTDVRSQMPAVQKPTARSNVDFPEVPRVSAYEAYVKFKAGKAIIIHAGGQKYESRHILGAFNVGREAVAKGRIKLPNFPKRGIEIFTYCY